MMLSMMSNEQMICALEELLPTEAPLLRGNEGYPRTIDRGVLAMLLILAKRVEELERLTGVPY